MKHISMFEAKTTLSALVEENMGEGRMEFVVARRGRPVGEASARADRTDPKADRRSGTRLLTTSAGSATS